MKSQAVRVADVLLIGPLMIWAAGQRSSPLSGELRAALAFIGLLTITYNAANYLKGGNY